MNEKKIADIDFMGDRTLCICDPEGRGFLMETHI
jgi:hypothetical protein